MASRLLSQCPSCGGKLQISSLTCHECGMELRGEFESEPSVASELSFEQREFLTTFLKCRGNMSQVQARLQISYPTAKSRLEEALLTLGLCEKEEIEKEREVIDVTMWQINENSTKPSEIVKRKLKESGGRVAVSSFSGNLYKIWAEPDGKSVGCDALHGNKITYDIFDVVIKFVEKNGGRAKKGTGRSPLGSDKCGLDTVAGALLQDYYGVAVGGYGFDSSFAVIAILEWAGILHNRRGYVELTAQYKAAISS